MYVFGGEPELRAPARSELNSVSRPERVPGNLLAIDKCSVPALRVLQDNLRSVVRDRCVASRDVGLRQRQIALRRAPNHEGEPVDDNSSTARTVDEFHRKCPRLWGFCHIQ